MKKFTRIILAVLLVPFLIPVVKAATTFIGQITQTVSFNGVAQPVSVSGTSSVSGSTVTVVGVGGAPVGVNVISAIPAGANTIGKVDQGVGGASAWKVDGSAVTQPISASSLPLPTGAATSASQTTGNASLSSIDGKLNSLGQKTSANSVPVVIASDQPLISVTTSLVTSGNVTKSSVTATSTSAQLLASQPTRTGVECSAMCTNTDYVFLNINSASAATVTDYPMSPCSSWSPPAGMVPTGAIQVISNSGSQVVRCVSYTP